MTFSIDNPEGGLQQLPFGKYIWEKPSGEQGLKFPIVLDLTGCRKCRICYGKMFENQSEITWIER